MMDKNKAAQCYVEVARNGFKKYRYKPELFYYYMLGAFNAMLTETDEKEDGILFLETISGQRFKSTKETILEAERDLAMDIASDTEASVNDWLDILGLHRTAIGDRMRWIVGNLPIIHFADGVDKDGNKVVCINYTNLPLSRMGEFDF